MDLWSFRIVVDCDQCFIAKAEHFPKILQFFPLSLDNENLRFATELGLLILDLIMPVGVEFPSPMFESIENIHNRFLQQNSLLNSG